MKISWSIIAAGFGLSFTLAAGMVFTPICIAASPCVPVLGELAGWWAGEGNANDQVNSNNGTVSGGVTYGTGKVGQGFVFSTSNGAVRIPASSNLNLGAGAGLTVETWINPQKLFYAPIAEWNNGSDWGAHVFILDNSIPGALFVNVRDAGGNPHLVMSAGGLITTNEWQHVAVTYDKASGAVALYRNGVIVGSGNIGSLTPQTSYDFYIGRRPAPSADAAYFMGMIDEMSLYNRALGSNEVAAIYGAGSAGKCPTSPSTEPVITLQPVDVTTTVGSTVAFTVQATGMAPLSYQWRWNGSNLVGETGPSLVISNAQLSQAGTYSVSVANTLGAVVSTGAALTVRLPNPGTVYFQNHVSSVNPPIDAPISYLGVGPCPTGKVNGATAILLDGFTWGGTNARVAIYGGPVGTPEESMQLLAPIAGFRSGAAAGYVNVGASGSRTVPTVPVAGTAVVQLRAWDTGTPGIATYEDAAALVGKQTVYLGKSSPLTVGPLGGGSPPAMAVYLAGLREFGMAPALPSVYDLSKDFSTNLNPAGVWSYGWKSNVDGAFNLYTFHSRAFSGDVAGTYLDVWTRFVNDQSAIAHNSSDVTVTTHQGQSVYEPGTTTIWPGVNGRDDNYAGFRFTAPAAGTYLVRSWARNLMVGWQGGDTDYRVVKNEVELMEQYLAKNTTTQTNSTGYTNSFVLAIGDTIDFLGGRGADGDFNGAALKLDVVITPTTQPLAPALLVQPVDMTTTAGSTVMFTVQATGTEPLSYQWRWNGSNLVGEIGTSLVISNVQASQAGTYTVLVTNTAGSVVSTGAVLTVTVPSPGTLLFQNKVAFPTPEINAPISYLAGGPCPTGKVNGATVIMVDGFMWGGVSAMAAVYAGPIGTPEDQLTLLLPAVPFRTGVAAGYVMVGASGSRAVPYVPPGGQAVVQVRAWDAGNPMVNTYEQAAALVGQQMVYLGKSALLTVGPLGGGSPPVPAAPLYGLNAFWLAPTNSSVPVNEPPTIMTQPAGQTVTVGATVTLSVEANGTEPLVYNWLKNGVGLNGQRNATLTILNAQMGDSGTYIVVVSNAYGVATSTNVMVIVNQPCSPAPSGLAGWWAGEGNANDQANSNNGTVSGGVTYGTGKVGQAFVFNTTNGAVRIPASSNLNVGAGGGLTIETWINPQKLFYAPIAEWNNGSTWGAHLFILDNNIPGALFVNLRDTSGSAHNISTAGGLITTNEWQHVAMTYDKASGAVVLYRNGAQVGSGNIGSLTPQTSYDFYVGRRPAPPADAAYFMGMIDEMSLYSRALASNEIAAIYGAGSMGKCPPPSKTNHPPVAFAQTLTLNEDTAVTITLGAVDVDGDMLSYEVGTPLHGTLTGTASNLVYMPATNYNGTDSFTFRVSDGQAWSEMGTVSLTILPVNDAPVAYGQVLTLNEDTTIAIMLGAMDVDGDALSYEVGTPLHGTLTGTAPNLVYTPVTNYNGTDSFTFRVSDGQAWSEMGTVSLTILPVNDAPVAYGQVLTLNEDTTIAIMLGAMDVDGDALSYEVGTPLHGTLTGTASNLVYTPVTNYNGRDSFTFRVSDGQAWSELATVSLTILPVNDAPVAYGQALTLNEDSAIAVTLEAMDVDGDMLSYEVGTPLYGTLTGTAPDLVYMPATNYNGTDSFTFRVSDGQIWSEMATVSLTILPVNDAPVARAQVFSPTLLMSNVTKIMMVSPNNSDAVVILDATRSADVDGDALSYYWYANGGSNAFASGMRVTNAMPIGTYEVVLGVYDGTAMGTSVVPCEVVSASESVADLYQQLTDASLARTEKRPLLAMLRVVMEEFEKGQWAQALKHLEDFQHKVGTHVEKADPALAQQLGDAAQAILDALEGLEKKK